MLQTEQEKRKEIQRQIDLDVKRYNESIYDGHLPQSFLDYFKKALMVVPPAIHQFFMKYVKILVKKKQDEINVVDVGMMINLIYQCPFKELYESLDEGIEYTLEFDKIRDEYNQKTNAMNQTLERKKRKLEELYGLTGKSVNMTPVIAKA